MFIPRTLMKFDRCFVFGLALGLIGGYVAIDQGRKQAVKPVAVAAPIVAPVATAPTQVDPAPNDRPIDIHAVKPGQVCHPYASNGTYLPELCGESNAFQGRLDEAFASN